MVLLQPNDNLQQQLISARAVYQKIRCNVSKASKKNMYFFAQKGGYTTRITTTTAAKYIVCY